MTVELHLESPRYSRCHQAMRGHPSGAFHQIEYFRGGGVITRLYLLERCREQGDMRRFFTECLELLELLHQALAARVIRLGCQNRDLLLETGQLLFPGPELRLDSLQVAAKLLRAMDRALLQDSEPPEKTRDTDDQ